MEKIDLRIQRTYRLLHEAFTDLMEEKRFEDITVGELCEKAMIRRTTFYKHFADKYEYFIFYMKEIKDSFKLNIATDNMLGDPNAYFSDMSRELIKFLCQHQQLTKHAMESAVFPMLFDSFSELIFSDFLTELHRRNGSDLQSDPSPEVAAAFYAGGLINAIRWWMQKGKPIDVEQLMAEIARIMSLQVSPA